MPSVNGSRRRHSKQPSLSKKTNPPPALSLTSSHDSSTFSTAQNTPRSIFSSGLRPSKRLGSRKAAVETKSKEEDIPKSMETPHKENVNVFAFMDKDDVESDESTREADSTTDEIQESASSSPVSSKFVDQPQRSPRYSDLEVRAIQDGVQRAWGRASLHSDSGISVHSSSPDQDSPVMQHKYLMSQDPPLIEETRQENEILNDGLQMSPDLPLYRGSSFSHRHWPSIETRPSDVPEACHPSPQIPTQFPHSPSPRMPEMAAKPASDALQRKLRVDKTTSKSKTGYDLLASNIAARNDAVLSPIYRKFETLKNRMLLYLQDEISEIEDSLLELDNAIAAEEAQLGEGPPSRRSEANLPSQLQWHRLDLLSRSFAKVEQYNRALTSYSALTRTLSPASTSSILIYKDWIAQHSPITPRETAFLSPSHSNDLITIAPPSPPPQPQPGLDNRLIVLAFAFVSTIIVFKVVPAILARLLISAVVGLASVCVLKPGVPTLGAVGGRRGVGAYVGVVLVLAVVVG